MNYNIKYIYFIIIFILIIIINEFIQGLLRQKERYDIYKLAKDKSLKINKKLLVVGDPYYGHGSKFYSLFMKNYDCGDITIDLTGAPKCHNSYKIDILSYLKKQPSNSLVIFISCVLEYVDDIDDIINEINRVAGDASNIFIVTVTKYSLSAYIYSDMYSKSKYIIDAPPLYNTITYKKINT